MRAGFKALSKKFVGLFLFTTALVLPLAVQAAPIDFQLVVTVRVVCDDAGANCASTGPVGNSFFEAEGDKIWAQAGIDLRFVMGANLNSTAALNGSSGIDFVTGGPTAGPGTTMFLMNTLTPGLFGNAWLNGGGLAINMSAVTSFNGGIGRLDTIAHELGHNLGLPHDDGNANFLMASGGIRNIPTSLAQICPDAPCRDLLTAGHIATARASDLLVAVPEPVTLALLGSGLAAVRFARRRRSRD